MVKEISTEKIVNIIAKEFKKQAEIQLSKLCIKGNGNGGPLIHFRRKENKG